MPEFEFQICAIDRSLENGTHLVEGLLLPEFSCLGDDTAALFRSLKAKARQTIEGTAILALHRRHASGEPTIDEVTVEVPPPVRSAAWTEPAILRFHVVRWSHGTHGIMAYVPALGIEVLAADAAGFDALVESEIRFALLRTNLTASLWRLLLSQRWTHATAHSLATTATVHNPERIAAEAEKSTGSQRSVLEEVGTDLTKQSLAPAYEMGDVVGCVAEALTEENPRSVLLTGPSGVGKTAVVHELVRSRGERGLLHTPFWAVSGSRLIAGMSGFGEWQERLAALAREASTKRIILYLGNLLELMEVGKSENDTRGIAAFLQPFIGRGEVLAIAECTLEQLPVIEREAPRLAEVFHPVAVEPPSRPVCRTILRKCAQALGGGSTLSEDGLDALERLHRRYATYSAHPGRGIRFLADLARDRPADTVLTAADVTAGFARQTGLPAFMLETSAPLDLDAVHRWFSDRIVGQAEAVGLVVDLLATAKAWLNRPHRPIASLLFIGPTGVGKTEMAKALAEFLFGHRQRMIRFDMSEYSDAIGVKRLIGGVFGSEGLLTARVREQPFSVVLLDEFEKAHPSFFDLLLQALGEGRLTDALGRVADFSSAVVIMTSNLGAESYRRGSFGFAREAGAPPDAEEHFVEEVRRHLRPELFNRIDRIVPFQPLGPATILAVARRELDLLRARDGLRLRDVTIDISEEVVEHLARAGYDPRYGARPLKRTIERELLVPLAEGLNSTSAELPLGGEIRCVEGRLLARVKVRPPSRKSAEESRRPAWGSAADCTRLRRKAQALDKCTAVLELRDEVFALDRALARGAGVRRAGPHALPRSQEVARRRTVLGRVERLIAEAVALEEKALLSVYGDGGPLVAADAAAGAASLEATWYDCLLALYSLRFENPDAISLAIYSESPPHLFNLARGYAAMAAGQGFSYHVFQLTAAAGKGRRAGAGLERRPTAKAEEFLAKPRDGVIGILLGVGGPYAYPLLEGESGVHEFAGKPDAARCLVHTSGAAAVAYVPPEGLERLGAIGRRRDNRRFYDGERGLAEDAVLKKKLGWTWSTCGPMLKEAAEERLRMAMEAMLDTWT